MGGHPFTARLMQTQPLHEWNRTHGQSISGKLLGRSPASVQREGEGRALRVQGGPGAPAALHVIDWDQLFKNTSLSTHPPPSTSRYRTRCLYVGATDEAGCGLSWYQISLQGPELQCSRLTKRAPPTSSVILWISWRTRGVHTDCEQDHFPIRRRRSINEGSALESKIPDEKDQCVLIHCYTIHERVFIPMITGAGAGPHQLPKGDHGDGDSSE